MTIGYLVSQYPAPSHTFIRRELATLRAAGFAVKTYSVRAGTGAEDAADAPTFAILSQSIASFVIAHLRALLGDPIRYATTLGLVLKHRVPGIRALVWSLFHFVEAILLADQLQRDAVTRLHNHFANSGATVGMLAAHYRRLPWSLTLHGISEFDYPAGLLLHEKIERATFAACVSYFGMAQAMRLTRPVLWSRLVLVRTAINPDELPKPAASERTRGSFALICVGRLSPEKGHAGLLAAVETLLRAGGDLKLTLVGDGPERRTLEDLVDALQIRSHVKFVGALNERDTLQAIARSDTLVLPSFMEGLPVVLMEAMALGVPVVASRVAGIPELVRDGKSGLLFDPANWAELSQIIARLAASPALCDSLAAQARVDALEQFAYPAAAAPLVARFGPAADG